MTSLEVLKETFGDDDGISAEAFHEQMRERSRVRGHEPRL